MEKCWLTKLGLPAMVATVLLTGCATIRRSPVGETEQLLAAAGFEMKHLDSAHEGSDATPPYRLISRVRNGAVEYAYADPKTCQCVYVGGSAEYSAYRRLATERQVARERLWGEEVERGWDPWESVVPW